MKDYHKPGYWKDWYWNRGGREKVQESRYIAEYNRLRKDDRRRDFRGTSSTEESIGGKN